MAHHGQTKNNHRARDNQNWRPRNGNGKTGKRKEKQGGHRNKYAAHSRAADRQRDLASGKGALLLDSTPLVQEPQRQKERWDSGMVPRNCYRSSSGNFDF
ncbi:MAG: hypothetical protein HYS26_04875 [Candidatus Kaiserbacteria bacterium]|nr:MAG: hypothetical protein HYS26_04875 [Candidatus Kaiserbacteria bacterium]